MIAMPVEPAGTPKKLVQEAPAFLLLRIQIISLHGPPPPCRNARSFERDTAKGTSTPQPPPGDPNHADERPHHRGDESQGPVPQVVQDAAPDFGEGIAGDFMLCW